MAFWQRRGFWVALVGIAVAACVAVTAISFFAARALTHHRSSRPSVTPADSGLTYQVVPLKARDGTVLEGWWIIPKDGQRRRDLATIVLAHTADGERPGALTGKAGMLRHAAWLSRAGFIVLAFDFRSYGGSEGNQTTGGLLEMQDLQAALDFARERTFGAPMAVLGEGLGATTAAMLTIRNKAGYLVADSPSDSWPEALLAQRRPIWTSLAVPQVTSFWLGHSGLKVSEVPARKGLQQTRSRWTSVMIIVDRSHIADWRPESFHDGNPSHRIREVFVFDSKWNPPSSEYQRRVVAFLDTTMNEARY